MLNKLEELQMIDKVIKKLNSLKLSEEQLLKYTDMNNPQELNTDNWELCFKIQSENDIINLIPNVEREIKLIESVKAQESKDKYIQYYVLNDWYILTNDLDEFLFTDIEGNKYLHLCKDVKIHYIN